MSHPNPPAVAVTGAALGWLELALGCGSALRVPAPAHQPAGDASGPPDGEAALPLEIRVDPQVADAAEASRVVQLTDPEGVALAELTVEGLAPPPVDIAGSTRDHWLLWGQLRARGQRVHHDYPALRRTPRQIRAEGPWAALWADPPPSPGLRSAAATVAQRAGLPLLHVATLDPAQETSLPAHLGARLAQRLHARGERAVVLPFPDVDWQPAHLLARIAVAASCGIRKLALEPGRLGGLPDPGALRAVAARSGVELVELGPDDDAEPLEPELAAEVRAVRRPRSRQGYTVFFTGLSGSGKSTLARRLVARLLERESRSVTLLDGDVVRLELSKGLTFSRADRETNVRRLGFVAAEVTKAGGVAVCCPIAPEDAVRRAVRARVEQHGLFLLVHVATPLEECERRDRKGLYAQARAGLIPEFTGISSPYEAPQDAEVILDTSGADLDDCVRVIVRRLEGEGLLA